MMCPLRSSQSRDCDATLIIHLLAGEDLLMALQRKQLLVRKSFAGAQPQIAQRLQTVISDKTLLGLRPSMTQRVAVNCHVPNTLAGQ